MSQAQIVNAVCVRDPQTGELKAFETKAEADMFLRRPLITAALTALGAAADLVTWLIDNSDTVSNAFSNDQSRRVTKAEKAKLKSALDAAELIQDPRLAFLVENAVAILESFKWPTVKKMTPDEAALAAKNTLMAALENNEEVVTWILEHKDSILKAFEEGVVKREVAPAATKGLNTYKLFAALRKLLPEELPAVEILESEVQRLTQDTTIESLYYVDTETPKHDFAEYLEGALDKLKVHYKFVEPAAE